jgi:hypothetical protein
MSGGRFCLASKQQSIEIQNVFHTLTVPTLARLYSFITTPNIVRILESNFCPDEGMGTGSISLATESKMPSTPLAVTSVRIHPADHRRLKLSDIVSLSRCRGELVFLSVCRSVCQTAQDISDQAIHIAAGMLVARYGSYWHEVVDHGSRCASYGNARERATFSERNNAKISGGFTTLSEMFLKATRHSSNGFLVHVGLSTVQYGVACVYSSFVVCLTVCTI